jgi:hypothetical protein
MINAKRAGDSASEPRCDVVEMLRPPGEGASNEAAAGIAPRARATVSRRLCRMRELSVGVVHRVCNLFRARHQRFRTPRFDLPRQRASKGDDYCDFRR